MKAVVVSLVISWASAHTPVSKIAPKTPRKSISATYVAASVCAAARETPRTPGRAPPTPLDSPKR